MKDEVKAYNSALEPTRMEIAEALAAELLKGLPKSEYKLWHGAPVWFDDGNPIAGYDNLKNGVRLLFWSGQSFDEPDLLAEGTFRAAEIRFTDVDQIETDKVQRWLIKAKEIQWDYKNIVKRKGVLERLK